MIIKARVSRMNIWIATEEAYDSGIVSDRLYSVYSDDVSRFSSSLGTPELWKFILEQTPFSQDYEFSRIIMNTIDSQPIQ